MTCEAPRKGTGNAIAALRRLATPKPVEDRCDFCAVAIASEHRHLLEVSKRKIVCVCDPCALRFQNVAEGRFKLIPRDPVFLEGFCLTDAQWDNLALPINLTFFRRDSAAGKVVAMYPSPAGATESLLPAESWAVLEAENDDLAKMEPDVQALLVNRIGTAREYFIAPIDVCYGLVGLIRMHWRGLSGGEKVWEEVGRFFAGLREKAGAPRTAEREECHA